MVCGVWEGGDATLGGQEGFSEQGVYGVQKAPPVQRPCGGTLPGVFEEQGGHQCDRNGESGGGWEGTGQMEQHPRNEVGATEPHDQTRVVTALSGGCEGAGWDQVAELRDPGGSHCVGPAGNAWGLVGRRGQEGVRRRWPLAMFTVCWTDGFRRLPFC